MNYNPRNLYVCWCWRWNEVFGSCTKFLCWLRVILCLLLMHQENASGHCCLCDMLRKAINRNSRIFVAVGCKWCKCVLPFVCSIWLSYDYNVDIIYMAFNFSVKHFYRSVSLLLPEMLIYARLEAKVLQHCSDMLSNTMMIFLGLIFTKLGICCETNLRSIGLRPFFLPNQYYLVLKLFTWAVKLKIVMACKEKCVIFFLQERQTSVLISVWILPVPVESFFSLNTYLLWRWGESWQPS